jgi:hypothetical protein
LQGLPFDPMRRICTGGHFFNAISRRTTSYSPTHFGIELRTMEIEPWVFQRSTMDRQINREHFLQFLLVVLATASFITLFFYPVLHEAGHLLAVKMFGGRIGGMDLRLFKAYALFSGSFTPAQTSIIDIAGFALPYCVWLLGMAVVRKTENWVVEYFKLLFSFMVLGTMLIWIIFPALAMFHSAPLTEDAVKFTVHSDIHGFLISGAFILLAWLSVMTLIKNTGSLKAIFNKLLYS